MCLDSNFFLKLPKIVFDFHIYLNEGWLLVSLLGVSLILIIFKKTRKFGKIELILYSLILLILVLWFVYGAYNCGSI